MGVFSQKKDAIPIAFFHGWPGSFLEFIELFKVLTERYTPASLPYHLVAPSLIGYTLTSGPPTDRDWNRDDTSRVMHKLLISLGFKAGYIAQGGDVGSSIARILGVKYDECKAVHLNFDPTGKPDGVDGSEITEAEAEGLKRTAVWQETGIGYAMEHRTRPSTIGLVLSSSPIALLGW
jgi:microsomal epoxide hydrolase